MHGKYAVCTAMHGHDIGAPHHSDIRHTQWLYAGAHGAGAEAQDDELAKIEVSLAACTARMKAAVSH